MTSCFLFLSSTKYSINKERNVKSYKLTRVTFGSLVRIQGSKKKSNFNHYYKVCNNKASHLSIFYFC
jgi:hypothetical protein